MALIGDRVLDNGLGVLNSEANEIVICSQEPTTYTEAHTTYKLGTKSSPTIAAPSDRTGGGREAVAAAISDGSVEATGTSTHFAITDTVNSRLLAVGALSSSQAVTSGNTFSLTSFSVGIPDPA